MKAKKRSLIKGGTIGDITYQCDLTFNNENNNVTVNYTPESGLPSEIQSGSLRQVIMDILPVSDKNTGVIHNFLKNISIKAADKLNTNQDMFDDITTIVKNYGNPRRDTHDNNTNVNFQSNHFPVAEMKAGNPTNIYKDIFGKYEIYNKEDERKFVTIDPSIIQIMIFDAVDINDIVYSLKLIYREKNTITLRYTTKLFPKGSQIIKFNNLEQFNIFNTTLGNKTIDKKYHNLQLLIFLKKYIKFYNFYRKCYKFEQECPEQATTTKQLIEYQLKYISILGKARFGDPIIQVRTATITDYIMSNLLFASPSYAFISGGYKGFKDNKYGVTRSGYEISKRYNRPILTIMCAEGLHDAHEFSDATLIYGEHWGEDSIALSQLTDGAIIIAPFGGWTYIECLTLLANRKIVGIYNDFFNILNYNGEARNDNANFFKFTSTEQKNIINYNINYYLILLYLINNENFEPRAEIKQFKDCLEFGVKLLSYLKALLKIVEPLYKRVKDAEDAYNKIKNTKPRFSYDIGQKTIQKSIADINIKTEQFNFSQDSNVIHLVEIITNFNTLKSTIDDNIKKYLDAINNVYITIVKSDFNYQNKIPKNCAGIWIKPIFDLITRLNPDLNNIDISATPATSATTNTECNISKSNVCDILNTIKIDITRLNDSDLFKSLNTNIIFVFSDVMYLNIYLNEYLNTPFSQENIQTKISELLKLKFEDAGILKDIIDNEKKYDLILDRNIDGTLDEANKTIINESKMRQNYTFKINSDCNNYTNLITRIKDAELSSGPDTELTDANKVKYKQEFNTTILEADRILLDRLLEDKKDTDPAAHRLLVRAKTEKKIIDKQQPSLFSRSITMQYLLNGNNIYEAHETEAQEAQAAQAAQEASKGGGVRRKNKY